MAVPAPTGRDEVPPLLRAATWVSIAALVVAALICVVWVLLGRDDDVIPKALLTVVLLAGFSGVAIMEARLAARRPEWFVLTSIVTWVIILVIGAVFIWMPIVSTEVFFTVAMRILRYAVVIAVFALGLQDVRLYLREHRRYVTPFTAAVAHVTVGLVSVLVLMLVFPLVVSEYVDFSQFYWLLAIDVTILAAVGTALLPLVRALLNPRPVRPPRRTRSWPTYPDGETPLPVTRDGSPDWDAYHDARQQARTGSDPRAAAPGAGGWHAPGPGPARPAATAGSPASRPGASPTPPAQTAAAPPAPVTAGSSAQATAGSPAQASAVPPAQATAGSPAQASAVPPALATASSPQPAASASPFNRSWPPAPVLAAASTPRPATTETATALPTDPDGRPATAAPRDSSAAAPASPAASAAGGPATPTKSAPVSATSTSSASAASAPAPAPVSARTVIADARAATAPSPGAASDAAPVYSRRVDTIPPRPPLPSFSARAGAAHAVVATATEPLSARSHGWWGGQSPTDGSGEPAMRWADDPKDWPTIGTRRSGVRRRSGS